MELNDRLVELLITLFDEDGTCVNTVELLNKDMLGGGGGGRGSSHFVPCREVVLSLEVNTIGKRT